MGVVLWQRPQHKVTFETGSPKVLNEDAYESPTSSVVVEVVEVSSSLMVGEEYLSLSVYQWYWGAAEVSIASESGCTTLLIFDLRSSELRLIVMEELAAVLVLYS